MIMLTGKKMLLLTTLSLLFFSKLIAQTDGYFMYPQPAMEGKYTNSVGLLAAGLPEDQVEEASSMIRGPLLNYRGLYGLSNNFLLYGAVYTNIITFHFSVGPKWGLTFDRFAFTVGYDIAYWFGKLEQFGFQSKIRGWISYPNLTVGYEFEKFAISVKGELIILTGLKEQQDEIEVDTDRNSFAGVTLGVYIEQPLWKDNYMLIGLKMNFTKFYYPTWAAFATFDRYLYVPEIVLGINL
jgi:hypothetical protein